MNEELRKALAAIKAKDVEGAKLILARLLQDEPDNVAAWVLMSRMAETEVQKAAFLRKILAIEPDHAYARKELATLQETAEEGEAAAAVEPGPEAPAADEEAQPEAEEQAQPEAEEQAQPEEQPVPEEEPQIVAQAAPAEEVQAAPSEEVEPPAYEEAQPQAEAPAVEEEPEAAAQKEEAAVEPAPKPEPEAEAEAQTVPPETGLPLSTDPFDYEAQAEGDTLPPWMADEDVILEAPEPAAPEAGEGEEEAAAQEIPEWLAEEPESEWLEQATAGDEAKAVAQVGEGRERSATPQTTGKAAARPSLPAGGSSGLVLGLAVVTIIVFLLLIYAAIRFLPGIF